MRKISSMKLSFLKEISKDDVQRIMTAISGIVGDAIFFPLRVQYFKPVNSPIDLDYYMVRLSLPLENHVIPRYTLRYSAINDIKELLESSDMATSYRFTHYEPDALFLSDENGRWLEIEFRSNLRLDSIEDLVDRIQETLKNEKYIVLYRKEDASENNR